MRRTLLVLVLMFTGAVLVSCQPAADQGASQEAIEADVQAIEAVARDYQAAVNAGDLDALMDLFAADVVWMPPNAAAADRAGVRDYYRSQFEAYTASLTVDVQEVEVAGDWAYTRGTYEVELAPKEAAAEGEGGMESGESASGETSEQAAPAGPTTQSGKYLNILRRQDDGSWKLSRHIWNLTSATGTSGQAEAAGETG